MTTVPEEGGFGSPHSRLGLLADPGRLGLATDLYQLTMAAGYLVEGLAEQTATFELFVRRLPPGRGYLLAAGLEQALEYLGALSFGPDALAYLRSLPVFAHVPERFFDYLAHFRFTADVNAIPEGTPVFPNEPLLQVRGPLVQAQLVETFLLAAINHQTAIASKAARIVTAAAGRGVTEFGARRAHGFDAAVYGARAAVIGGCVGTSNVLAGQAFGIAVYGTAAHSFTMAFPSELEAFQAFHRLFPQHAFLLLDTYDTLEGARRATRMGTSLCGVRLDSGDLAGLSKAVRRILDDAGLNRTQILASGDLDEERIAGLVAAGAPIDLFGVGTELITSRDAPALGGVYKLVEIERGGRALPVRKLSEEKATYPGAKQLFRQTGPDGRFHHDTLALAAESLPGEPLLVPVLRAGARCAPAPDLAAIRARARSQLAALPAGTLELREPEPYPVELSQGLRRATEAWRPGES